MTYSKEKHERFVTCLEKYGPEMSGNEWSLMAVDLECSVDDVKLYAYWYMQQLQLVNHSDNSCDSIEPKSDIEMKYTGDASIVNNTADKKEERYSISDYSEWTYEETLLFDTLLVTYDTTTPHRWERIASLIPNKVQKQCQKRWETSHSSKNQK